MKSIVAIALVVLMSAGINKPEDHSEYIEGPFRTPQEVTETCLMCHEGVDQDIMKTRHWSWEGKQKTINNFCIALPSNWPRCTSCHISYGWKDPSFDFSDGNNIDCLICHDQTGTYKKVPTGAGMPDPEVDLVAVAKSVGRTTIKNCASCHFNGGGGDGVKHGDLDGSLLDVTPELDVHMGMAEMTCTDCHMTDAHQIMGAGHSTMAEGGERITCELCHGEEPHEKAVFNKHYRSVACETCHIPEFARVEPTKTWWDWSTAGQDKEVTNDANGKPLYDKKKGDFEWDKNVIPTYRWYNGKADYYELGQKIDPSSPVELNSLNGDKEDSEAKIYPFKLMKGKQIYDVENNYMVVPNLFGPDGYWKTFDWDQAAEIGMKTVGLDYSGKHGFVETEMYWPITHMVAPAKDALRCTECHFRGGKNRLDWKALGYDEDPVRQGGRFR